MSAGPPGCLIRQSSVFVTLAVDFGVILTFYNQKSSILSADYSAHFVGGVVKFGRRAKLSWKKEDFFLNSCF